VKPEQILQFYGRDAWTSLMAESWPGRIIHGQKLVMAISAADNVDRARQCLRAAEKLGMIERRIYRPSREQQFFGLNSQFGKPVLNPEKTGHDEVAYEWEVIRCSP
jgi:hypothetical protein